MGVGVGRGGLIGVAVEESEAGELAGGTRAKFCAGGGTESAPSGGTDFFSGGRALGAAGGTLGARGGTLGARGGTLGAAGDTLRGARIDGGALGAPGR